MKQFDVLMRSRLRASNSLMEMLRVDSKTLNLLVGNLFKRCEPYVDPLAAGII
jgi:hypothetical protein